jgi:hypothetical protein
MRYAPDSMNDEFDREEELEEFEGEPISLVTTEPVDRVSYVAVIHDSFGERYVNVALMRERVPAVSVLRILGAMNPEPRGEVQYFVNGGQVTQEPPSTLATRCILSASWRSVGTLLT